MPNQITKLVIDLLKKNKVEISDEVADAIQSSFGTQVAAEEGDLLQDGYVSIAKEQHNALKRDVSTLRKDNKAQKETIENLEEAEKSGDSQLARTAKTQKERLAIVEPIATRHLEQERKRWNKIPGNLDEDMLKRFTIPAEGEDEIDDDTMFENLKKYDDYVDVGAIDPTTFESGSGKEEGEGEPTKRVGAKVNQSGKHNQGKESLEGLSSAELIEKGIKDAGKTPERTSFQQ